MGDERTGDAVDASGRLVVQIGHEELVIRKKYQVVSIVNDIMVGIWFLVGSFLFFGESTTYAGTWLFVIGSAQLLIRPVIRLARHIHLQRFHSSDASAAAESTYDF